MSCDDYNCRKTKVDNNRKQILRIQDAARSVGLSFSELSKEVNARERDCYEYSYIELINIAREIKKRNK